MSNKFKKIVSVSVSITTIAWMSGAAMLAPIAASAAVAGVVEGDIIKTATSPDVYIAKYVGAKAFKRLILSPSVFNSYGHLKWSNIKTVSQATMDQFTDSQLVRALGDTKVYKLSPTPNSDEGSKSWLNMSAEAFTAGGYDWDSIYVINNVDRDSYTTGTETTGAGATVTPGVAGTLTVSLASDTPAAGMAVANAARVPFTKINLTAGASDVTITALTIQRTGLADDAALSSLALIDAATNLQVGLNQSLNASHQVVFRDTLTIPANTTKSYILAANMPATTSTYAGMVASLTLVSVTTSATVSGALPITGNYQTVNGTLTIGTVTGASGALHGATSTKEVGTTGLNFTSVKLTAGSAEALTVYSIRFNQSGSAAASDLANIVVSDGTTNYATTVSSDGKYYTASFGTSGLVIDKGLSKEFTVKGDILSGSNRTIRFDVYRTTDIVVKGNVYGYYITIAANTTWPFNTSSNPVVTGNTVTIGTGSLRVDKSTSGAPAVNVAKGATQQAIGSFDFVVQGEPVNVTQLVLTVASSTTSGTGLLSNFTLYKGDGTVLAGPVNSNAAGTSVTFSSTITFAVGTTQVIVKGDFDNNWVTNDTVYCGFNTPTSATTATGATTGNTVSATPASAIYGNTMTVKGGALVVTVSAVPVAQDVVKGASGFTFANYIFDASASGEDLRVTSIQLTVIQSGTNGLDLSNMVLHDGSATGTALNSGSNVPTMAAGTSAGAGNDYTFTLDNPLVITKGTIKTLVLTGNITAASSAGDWVKWGLKASATISVTGGSTGLTITATGISAAQGGQKMTIRANGQWSIVLDSSTPTGKLIASNTTGNIMTVLKLKATGEQITITKLRLGLTSASSTGIDLANVYIYGPDGALLSSGVFNGQGGADAGTNYNASTTFVMSPGLVLAANQEKLITIKADIAGMDPNSPIATAGHQIAIDYQYNSSTNMNVGSGSSGSIAAYSPTTTQGSSAGYAYIYRSVPTVTKLAVSNSTLANGTMDIYKFKVAASASGDIDLLKFTFKISSTSPTTGGPLTLKDLTLVDVTSSAEETLNATTSNTSIYPNDGKEYDLYTYVAGATWGTASTTRTVSAGSERTFVLRATIGGSGAGASVTTQLLGDAAVPTAMSAGMLTFDAVESDTNDDFIWSDLSSASHDTTPVGSSVTDWMNGYLVSGLPSSNLAAETLSK